MQLSVSHLSITVFAIRFSCSADPLHTGKLTDRRSEFITVTFIRKETFWNIMSSF